MVGRSAGDEMAKSAPLWVAERLGVAVEDVATLQVPNDGLGSTMEGPYYRYLAYLAKVAWDLGYSREADFQAAKSATMEKEKSKDFVEEGRCDRDDNGKGKSSNLENVWKMKKVTEWKTCSPAQIEDGTSDGTGEDVHWSNGRNHPSIEYKHDSEKPKGTRKSDEEDDGKSIESGNSGSVDSKLMTNGKNEKNVINANDEDVDDEVKNGINPGLTNVMFNRFTQKSYERVFYSGFFGSSEEIAFAMPQRNVKAEYGIGLGCAVLSVNGTDLVYCIHEETGMPTVGLRMFSHTPRVVNLYAKDTDTLKAVTEEMIEMTAPKPPKKPKSGKYLLYSLEVDCSGDGRWTKQGLKQARSLSSVVLPDGMMDSIVEDFKDFTSKETKAWFLSHGLPYRRSYLFLGPPGTGKTSLVRALAGTFQIPACFITFGNVQIGNKQLHDAMKNVPKPSILVFEDIDSLFNENQKAESSTQLTFSGLLNALDGLVAAEGVVSIMTTNHVELLDPALIRAGRVDRRFEFTTPHHEQVMKLFLCYYPDADAALQTEFANKVFARKEKEARSIATLQQHFIYTRKNSARESIDLLDKFFTQFYPTSSSTNMTYYL